MLGRMRHWTLILSATMTLLISPTRAENNCLVGVTHPTPWNGVVLPDLLSSLQDSGICIETKTIATARAKLMLQQGRIDAELIRVPSYQSAVEGVAIMIPEAILEGYGLLVVKTESNLNIANLREQTIGIGRGVVWQKAYFPEGASSIIVDSYESGMIMLLQGRIAGLMIEDISLAELKMPETRLFSRRMTPKLSGHLFLHIRHNGLVPKLNQAIIDWKKQFYRKAKGL